MRKRRIERDSLGPVAVPAGAYYGAQTQRAIDNFPISGTRFPRRFLWALGLIKRSAAEENEAGERLDTMRAEWICAAAQEVMDGSLDADFPLDIFQTGSGTSTHMNVNEVISNRAIELMGGELGSRDPVHPNDHVNLGQSSNDVIPSALHIAVATAIHQDLLPALASLRAALADRAAAFAPVLKSGRTHLMDATPMRLGQEFGAFARQVALGEERAGRARDALMELALGGTAVGTGLNRAEGFPEAVVRRIARETELPFVVAANPFEAQAARDAAVEASGLLRVIAVSLIKIANDIRLLASGPRTGLAEIRLPAVAPGSSIMPGKVNPVLCEMLVMVGYQVMGLDAAVALCGQGGQLQLNATLPLIAHNLLQSVALLSQGAQAFADRCVAGIEADPERCAALLDRNLSLATALAPALGYDAAAILAKEAFDTGRSLRELALERKLLPADQLDALLDPAGMLGPGA